MKSCGYKAIYYLLKKYSINYKKYMYKVYSFKDFYDICSSYGLLSNGFSCTTKEIKVPCIAHISKGTYQHYIYLIHVGKMCIYRDNCHIFGILPTFLFNKIFSGKIFRIINKK